MTYRYYHLPKNKNFPAGMKKALFQRLSCLIQSQRAADWKRGKQSIIKDNHITLLAMSPHRVHYNSASAPQTILRCIPHLMDRFTPLLWFASENLMRKSRFTD